MSESIESRGLLGRLVVLRRDGEGDIPRPESDNGRLRLLVGVELGGGVGVCIVAEIGGGKPTLKMAGKTV